MNSYSRIRSIECTLSLIAKLEFKYIEIGLFPCVKSGNRNKCNLKVLNIQLVVKFPSAGGTEELAAVVNHLTSVLNHKRLIGLGFSMGANILMKYLGEEPSRQEYFECGISVCQGYDILR